MSGFFLLGLLAVFQVLFWFNLVQIGYTTINDPVDYSERDGAAGAEANDQSKKSKSKYTSELARSSRKLWEAGQKMYGDMTSAFCMYYIGAAVIYDLIGLFLIKSDVFYAFGLLIFILGVLAYHMISRKIIDGKLSQL